MTLFLDLDGVMIPAKPWKAPELMTDGFPVFSAAAVQVLNAILAEAGVTSILLTSSHKARYTAPEWMAMFSRRGIMTTTLACLPENVDLLNRMDEIVRWLDLHPVDRFLILDDDTSLHGLPPSLKACFVQPSPMIGLSEQQLDQIRKIVAQDASTR